MLLFCRFLELSLRLLQLRLVTKSNPKAQVGAHYLDVICSLFRPVNYTICCEIFIHATVISVVAYSSLIINSVFVIMSLCAVLCRRR